MRGALKWLWVAAAAAFVGSFSGVAAQENAPDTVILKGAPLGGVLFVHASHQTMTECTACHHESRPAKPLASPYQPCTACHTKSAMPPMTTSIRDAYHDATGKVGTCMDCHISEAAAGKVVPVKCTECHKKEHK